MYKACVIRVNRVKCYGLLKYFRDSQSNMYNMYILTWKLYLDELNGRMVTSVTFSIFFNN